MYFCMTPEESPHPSMPVCHAKKPYPTIPLMSAKPLAASMVTSAKSPQQIRNKRKEATCTDVRCSVAIPLNLW